ncbi:MAG: hypothetical protein Q8W49_13305 [Candidatus Palauibacterales bacterium]|nr:hypothetical protein [Candidatus Palauibacterales bacterium]
MTTPRIRTLLTLPCMLAVLLTGACADQPTGLPDVSTTAPPVRLATADAVPITTDLVSTTGVPMASLAGTAAPAWLPHAINAIRWVTGTQDGVTYAVLWRGNGPEILPRPEAYAGASMEGLGINDDGVVVGRAHPNYFQPFVWDPDTGITTLLPYPGDALVGSSTQATDIDAAGNVLVTYFNRDSNCQDDAAVWSGSIYASLNYMGGCETSVEAEAIDDGTVIGFLIGSTSDAFRWSGGTFTLGKAWKPVDLAGDYAAGQADIGTGALVPVVQTLRAGGFLQALSLPDGSTSYQVSAVNAIGWVVGRVTVNGETHAYLWKSPSEAVDLGTLEGDAFSWATDVNDAGYIVGTSRASASTIDHPVVWHISPAGGTTPPANQPPTATITAPSDGAQFLEGEDITFEGSGTDPEDGSLSGTSLVWTSDLDGQLGTSTGFDRSDLSVGTHEITLTATDADGAAGSASVSITVQRLTPTALADLVADMLASGAITDPDVAQGLTDKLEAAQAALDRGSTVAAGNILRAFIDQVEAQRGNAITDEAADELIGFAERLLSEI